MTDSHWNPPGSGLRVRSRSERALCAKRNLTCSAAEYCRCILLSDDCVVFVHASGVKFRSQVFVRKAVNSGPFFRGEDDASRASRKRWGWKPHPRAQPSALPNSLTFASEVRRQVARFSPSRLPNLLTYALSAALPTAAEHLVKRHEGLAAAGCRSRVAAAR